MALNAASLLKSVGLFADGPVLWGARVRSGRPGVFIVELPAPLPQAPIDLSTVGRWIDRVPSLKLDGRRPVGKELSARLGSFWIPEQTILFIGSTAGSVGGRIASIAATPLGDRRPYAGAHWLRTLRNFEQLRVWWSETDAPEEYEDALMTAFGEQVDPASAARLPDRSVILPFANLQTATGERKGHGVTGALLALEVEPSAALSKAVAERAAAARAASAEGAPAGRTAERGGEAKQAATATSTQSTSADADHPRQSAAASLAAGRSTSPVPSTKPAARRGSTAAAPRARGAAKPSKPAPPPAHLSAAGVAQLEAELEHLTTVRRPEVVARIKAARELGDLRENADYEAARREQSFLEGRVQNIEETLKNAVIIGESVVRHDVVLGSTVVVDADGLEETYTIVGSAEANPADGKISYGSPIGRALLGRTVGDDVEVKVPAGTHHYRILEVR